MVQYYARVMEVGNSLAVVIRKDDAAGLGIKRGNRVKVTVEKA